MDVAVRFFVAVVGGARAEAETTAVKASGARAEVLRVTVKVVLAAMELVCSGFDGQKTRN